MDIKVFGERNTATNALIKVIETNSDTRCIPGTASGIDPAALRRARKREFSTWLKERTLDGVFRGVPDQMTWKHAATNFTDADAFRDTHVIFTVRHPASWLLGLYRKPYHILSARPDSFAEFIRMSWKTVARERLNRCRMSLPDLYETKLRRYDDFAAKLADVGASHSFVRFEDF
ncbi:hypothetical protein HA397_26415, partial [Escherichia coli]|nr:hypothetical protein [Escherichia coli]